MSTPLIPTIAIEERKGFTVCNQCGAEDGTVQYLVFKSETTHAIPGMLAHSHSTSVALCQSCREMTQTALTAMGAKAAEHRCGCVICPTHSGVKKR